MLFCQESLGWWESLVRLPPPQPTPPLGNTSIHWWTTLLFGLSSSRKGIRSFITQTSSEIWKERNARVFLNKKILSAFEHWHDLDLSRGLSTTQNVFLRREKKILAFQKIYVWSPQHLMVRWWSWVYNTPPTLLWIMVIMDSWYSPLHKRRCGSVLVV